jgi:hypothetical protein
MANSHRPTTLGATRARQGRFGRHVVWVLLFGTLLAALALFGAWTWKSGDLASTEPSANTQAMDARRFNAPEPAPINPTPQQYAASMQTPPAKTVQNPQ